MNKELAEQLKAAGFPISDNPCFRCAPQWEDGVYSPTLSELISACGDRFGALYHMPPVGEKYAPNDLSLKKYWIADDYAAIHIKNRTLEYYETPEEAVARLFIALNKKDND